MSVAIPRGERIVGYDVARGVAYCGMVVVNFAVAMVPAREFYRAKAPLGWFVEALSGRASALFVLLAGAGLSLMTKRARESGDADALRACRRTLLRRALFLFVAGLLYHGLWVGDILHYYGVYIAIGAAALRASTRGLAALAATACLGFPILFLVFDYSAHWNWETFEYPAFWTLDGFVRNLFFNGFHPVFPWVGFLFAGMIVGRVDWSRSRRRWAWAGSGALVALAAHRLSSLLLEFAVINHWHESLPPVEFVATYLSGTGAIPPTPLYFLSALGTAIAVLCLSLELSARFPRAFLVRALAATGQLALTLYIAHVVVAMGAWDALDMLHGRSLASSTTRAVAVCVASIAFATLWRWRFERGPLEWLLRRVAG